MRICLELVQLYYNHNYNKLVDYYYYYYYYHHILLVKFVIFCRGTVLPGVIVLLDCSIFVFCCPSSCQ